MIEMNYLVNHSNISASSYLAVTRRALTYKDRLNDHKTKPKATDSMTVCL